MTLIWIVGFSLVAFELTAGMGKVLASKMAMDWMNRLGLTKPFVSAFGGLEVGAVGIILINLFNLGGLNDKLVPWACLAMIVLKAVELILQKRSNQPFAAMVGPIVVIVLTVTFYSLKMGV